MIASRLSILYIFLITLISYNLHAHEVSLISGDFKKTEDSWSLEIELDATLTVPELRENRDAPQPSREWLYEQSNEQYQAMREEAERFFKDFLVFKHGNETQEYTITFPNFDKSPPEFSKLQNEGAYLKIILNGNISADQLGDFSIELISGTSRGIFIAEAARLSSQYSSLNDGVDPELSQSNGLAVVGDVAAGAPIFASEHVQQYVNVDQALFSDTADYLLKVKGDSMINIGIFEQDLLAIKKADTARDNEIVVARLGDDVTVKRFQRQGASVSLIAENDDYSPINVDLQTETFAIEGVVVGLIRRWC